MSVNTSFMLLRISNRSFINQSQILFVSKQILRNENKIKLFLYKQWTPIVLQQKFSLQSLLKEIPHCTIVLMQHILENCKFAAKFQHFWQATWISFHLRLIHVTTHQLKSLYVFIDTKMQKYCMICYGILIYDSFAPDLFFHKKVLQSDF